MGELKKGFTWCNILFQSMLNHYRNHKTQHYTKPRMTKRLILSLTQLNSTWHNLTLFILGSSCYDLHTYKAHFFGKFHPKKVYYFHSKFFPFIPIFFLNGKILARWGKWTESLEIKSEAHIWKIFWSVKIYQTTKSRS